MAAHDMYAFTDMYLSVLLHLQHRKQYVDIDDPSSPLKTIVNGALQGQMLGPLFCVVYRLMS